MQTDVGFEQRVASRVQGRRRAQEVLGLGLDCLAGLQEGGAEAFWEYLRDESLKRAPLPGKAPERLKPMGAKEAREYGGTTLGFGSFGHKFIGELDLEYLEWLRERSKLLAENLGRYLLSRSVQSEQAEPEEPEE